MQNSPRRFIRNQLSDIGSLIDLDERLNHQIVDTFASTATSEQSWTEKIWTAVVRKDGGLGVDFGLGRYHNRGVMDGWAAVSRGSEQWTVRASRELRDDPTITEVGPIAYEILEPLHKVRYVLARNEAQPIAFDITFTSELPPFFEDRHKQREIDGHRIGSDVIRYHQCGVPEGWVELNGERIEIRPEEWTEYRDHSWGTRLDVGAHNADVKASADFGDARFGEGEFVLIWSPFMLVDPETGEKVEYHFYYQSKQGRIFYSSGYRNHPDGTQEKVARVRPELRFEDRTRRLLGGEVHFDMLQGGTRSVTIEVLGTSGVHLGPGLYLGFDGKKHGSWKGQLEVEGEHFADTLDRRTLERIRQVRDCPIRVMEGNASGFGIMETIIHGEHPELGLTAANSFI